MADELPRSEENEGSKSKGWNKLRGKIFDKEMMLSKFKRQHSNDSDVDEFLRPSNGSSTSLSSPSGPKLDISAAKAHSALTASEGGFLNSTSARVGGEGAIPSYAPTREDMMSGKWTPHKPSRQPGLSVGFFDGPADVIGEGGDESEELPATIGKRRALNQSMRRQAAGKTSYHRPSLEEPPVPPHLRRAPTGMAEDSPIPPSDTIPRYDVQPTPPAVSPHRRKPSLVPYPSPGLVVGRTQDDRLRDEEEIIKPLRRAPTRFHEAQDNQQQGADLSSELHLASPESPPSSRQQQASYEQQMQQILTNTYSHPAPGEQPLSGAEKAPPQIVAEAAPDRDLPRDQHARPSLRTHSASPNRRPERQLQSRMQQPPEMRSPIDSGSMKKMRAEEGLVHRSSVQGVHSISGGNDSVATALSKLSSGLEAPPPYSTQARSSFDSIRSGDSERSRYSHSPEPASLPPHHRFSVASVESANFLTPPASSHGQQQRPNPLQRKAVGSQESLPPSFHDKPTANETSVAHGSRAPNPASFERPQPLNIRQQSNKPPGDGRPLSIAKDPSAEEAYTHFASAVSGSGSIFRLAAESAGFHVTVYDWTRCALWWFLKGREGIEGHVRFQASQRASPRHSNETLAPDSLRQHHLNLAKSYWMLTEIIPHLLNNTPSDPKSCPPSQSLSSVDAACGTLDDAFKILCLLMRRHDILPPPQEKFIQGLDSSIWVPQTFEKLPADWQWVLSGKVFAPPRQTPDMEPMTAIPLQDTRSSYCYGRVFVSATVALGEEKPTVEPFECVLSFVRGKSSAEAEVVISSQSSDLNVYIRAAGEQGVHWEHTKFEEEERSFRIKLPQKLRLKLFCSHRDYNFLWNFFDNSQRISQSLMPKKNEQLLQTLRLRSFQYRDTAHPDEFPSDPVGVCRAALFEQLIKSGRNPRTVHAGYRFAVVNLEKTVRNVNVSLGKTAPFEYNVSSSQPSLQFQLNEVGRRRSAHMVFEDISQRDMFRDLLSGTVLGNQESVLCQLPIKSLALSRATATNLAPAIVRWSSIQVIDEDDPADPLHLTSSADASQNLRVMMYDRTGSIVDRLNDAVVDFKIRVEMSQKEQLHIYRSTGRQDLTIAVGPDPSASNELRQMFDIASSGPHVSVYSFANLKDLHTFQRVVTGFAVKYDGIAASFSIPRRKPGSVIAKSLESKEARVQIVERERVTQLIAFFNDYILADGINFELRATDRFDQTDSKSLGPGVKLVDAKFVLPGSGKDDPVKDGAVRDAGAKYTTFETENYNQEHDDITVSFRTEQERDAFAEALPAPVSAGNKKFTLRRRI